MTPLHEAAEGGQAAAVEALLEGVAGLSVGAGRGEPGRFGGITAR